MKQPTRMAARARLAAAVLLFSVVLGACQTDGGQRTEVLGVTETRPTETSLPTVSPGESSTSSTTAVGGGTSSTTDPAPSPCRNPLLGYTVTSPAGWFRSGDLAAFAPCEAFDPRPIAGGAAEDVAIVIRSLGPVHELLDPTAPARTAQRLAPADTRRDGEVTVAGRPAARFDATSPAGRRTYTYLIDAGPTVLAAQYSGAPGQTSHLYAAGRRALDDLVASLRLGAPGCVDRTDARCGAFYTADANAPIRITLPTQPINATAGQATSFDVTVDDADADDLRITTSDSCVQIIDAGSVVRVELWSLVRSAPRPVDGRYGPWRSPPRAPGHATFSVSHVFPNPGPRSLYLSVRSANSAFPALLDPYASFAECTEVGVLVG